MPGRWSSVVDKQAHFKVDGSVTAVAQNQAKERDKRKKDPADKQAGNISDKSTKPLGEDDAKNNEPVEVMTRQDFDELETLIQSLAESTEPVPMPTVPDNQRLMQDISRGSTTLTDTMQVMQLAARLQAAESGIENIVHVFNQLNATGAMPQGFMETAHKILHDYEATKHGITREYMEQEREMLREKSAVPEDPIRELHMICPVRPEVGATLDELYQDILNKTGLMISATDKITNNAVTAARNAADKIKEVNKMEGRIATLMGIQASYADYISGFDEALTTQADSFTEQVAELRRQINDGLRELEASKSGTESAAMLDLQEKYDKVVSRMHNMLETHDNLKSYQQGLSDELHTLMGEMEELREVKCDYDEVTDALNDKADISRLEALMTEEEFKFACDELHQRLLKSQEKFRAQEEMWETVEEDIVAMTNNKAQFSELEAREQSMMARLDDLNEKVQRAALLLSTPEAGIVTMPLVDGGLQDVGPGGEAPVPLRRDPCADVKPLPPRPQPVGAAGEEPCMTLVLTLPPEQQGHAHACHRGTGGSHTLLTNIRYVQAPKTLQHLFPAPESCVPCEECNASTIPGAAERDNKFLRPGLISVISPEDAPKVTVLDHQTIQAIGDSIQVHEHVKHVTMQPPQPHSLPAMPGPMTHSTHSVLHMSTNVGYSVKGHVTMVDERQLQREGVKQDIVDIKRASSTFLQDGVDDEDLRE